MEDPPCKHRTKIDEKDKNKLQQKNNYADYPCKNDTKKSFKTGVMVDN